MICPTCGTENRPGAKFCSECATALSAACPSCGTTNPPAAKFCSECATPLQPGVRGAAAGAAQASTSAPAPAAMAARGTGAAAAAGPVSERRLVSVLFADLVDWTRIAESGDSEDARDLLSRYFELASEVIARYGGVVEKFIGDAVMAVWGTPITREDDPERAVRAALDLVDAVRALGPGIQARAGVLTGEAAVTLGATNQGMVAGDLVNTASRLQSAAAPGVVLVGEATQRSAAGSIVFEPAGDQVLKGKAAPVAAWRAVRIVAERGGRNRSETLEAPFIGRDEELRQLKDLFHATGREGKPRLVSVMGPAGIGKSRLAWEFLKYLDGLVGRVWYHGGRSPAYGEGVTFWALGEMVRGRAGLAETDDEVTTRERIASTVREHVPDEAERPWIESALLALLGLEGGMGSEQLFAAWRTFFERLAATSPVVMVFEDLHYADNGLLDFIDHLLEWSRSSPIMVITLARPELQERRPDWGIGKRAFSSIHLEPLSEAEMAQLLAGLVPGLPPGAMASIVSRADGIPLYAIETVRMLLAQGRLVLEEHAYHPVGDIDDVAVPETLTALIAARLDSLDAGDRAVIEDAAVLGQSFTVAGLAAVAGQSAEDLEPRLRGLVRREILLLDADPRSPERGQYAFVQALIREVAYNTLAKKERKARHLSAARFFEGLGSDELAGGLAGHYLAAQQLAADPAEADALAAQARISLRAAAERAASLGSHDQALRFLEQALEVTTTPAERADIHEWAYQSASHGLDPQKPLGHAEAALDEHRRGDDRAAMAKATARHAQAISTFGNDPKRALVILTAAWEEFADLEETPAGVELMVAIGRAYRGLANDRESLTWNERYLPIAERLGLLIPIARGILGRGTGLLISGRPREGIILLRGAHQLAEIHGLAEVELNCRVLLTFYEQWGEPAAGLTLGRDGLELGRRLGSRSYGFQMVGNASICAFRVGEWDWASDLLDEWLALEITNQNFAEFFVDRAILHALRGEDQTADIEESARLRAGITDPQYESYEFFARAWGALAAGDLVAASALAEQAMSTTNYFTPLATPIAARSALWSGDAETARRLLAQLAEASYWGLALEADRTRLEAGIAALEGRSVEALAGFREAIRQYAGLGLDFEEAAAAVDLAILLPAADRDTPEVAAILAAARDTLTRLRSRPFLERLDAALAGRGTGGQTAAAGGSGAGVAAGSRDPSTAEVPAG